MIAHLVAVVGREHHERVIGPVGGVEVIEQAADLVVDLGHVAPIGRSSLAGLGLVERAADDPDRELMEQVAGRLGVTVGVAAKRRSSRASLISWRR